MRMIRLGELEDVGGKDEAVVLEGLVPFSKVISERGLHLVHVEPDSGPVSKAHPTERNSNNWDVESQPSSKQSGSDVVGCALVLAFMDKTQGFVGEHVTRDDEEDGNCKVTAREPHANEW